MPLEKVSEPHHGQKASCKHCFFWERKTIQIGMCKTKLPEEHNGKVLNVKSGTWSNNHPKTNQFDYCLGFEITLETK